jgi:uncharacterized protein YggE
MKIFRKLIIAFIVLSLTSCAKTIVQRDNVLEVFGVGEIEFLPDFATLVIGILNSDQKPEKAIERTKNTINVLDKILLELNINEDNIKKSNVESVRQNDQKEYSSNQYFSIDFVDINQLDGFLEKIITYEDIVVVQFNYSNTNINDYEIQAGVAALKNAERKALEMAKEMDIKLGKIISVKMEPFYNERRYAPAYYGFRHEMEWKQTITRTVSVGYKIK